MTLGALGKYALVSKHAAGGMAEIYLAKQLGAAGFERNVVVKRLHEHLTGNEDFVRMFLDEARLAARLTHPNIVAITDLGEADGSFYIAMEYLAGEDLATLQRLARRGGKVVPPNVVTHVVAQAAMGLHFAHEAKDDQGRPLQLIHRDVSPSNIFVTYDGQVKVLDFGIAKAESQVAQTAVGIVRGKHQYMSPEQASGQKLDRRTDVYSLGVTLYELLTQTRPFAHETDLATLKAVLEGAYPAIDEVKPELAPELVALVKKAMALDREQRFDSALSLALALEQLPGALLGSAATQAVSAAVQGVSGPARVQGRSVIPSYAELQASGSGVPWAPGMSLASLPAVDPLVERVTPSNPAAPRPSVPKSSPGTPGLAYASSASPVPGPPPSAGKGAKGTPGAVRLNDVLPAPAAAVDSPAEGAQTVRLSASALEPVSGAPATVRLRPSRPTPAAAPADAPPAPTGAPETVRMRPLTDDPAILAARGLLHVSDVSGAAAAPDPAAGEEPTIEPGAAMPGVAESAAPAAESPARASAPTGSSAAKLVPVASPAPELPAPSNPATVRMSSSELAQVKARQTARAAAPAPVAEPALVAEPAPPVDAEPARPAWSGALLGVLVLGALAVLSVAGYLALRRPPRPRVADAPVVEPVVEPAGTGGAAQVAVAPSAPAAAPPDLAIEVEEARVAPAAVSTPTAAPPGDAPAPSPDTEARAQPPVAVAPAAPAPTARPDAGAMAKRPEVVAAVKPAPKPVAPAAPIAAPTPAPTPAPARAPAPASAADDAKVVVAKFLPRLLGCFSRFPDDAPSKKGRTDLTLWVDGTGRVTRADVDLSESSLSRCVRGVSKEMRFQPSAERAAKLTVPLNYDTP